MQEKRSRHSRKQQIHSDQAREIRARSKKRIRKLKRRLEADGVAEALRSFVRAAIAQEPKK